MRTFLCILLALVFFSPLLGQSLRNLNLNKYKYIVIDDVSGGNLGETRRFIVKNLEKAGYDIVNLSEPLKTYEDYPNDLNRNKDLAVYLSVNTSMVGACYEVEVILSDYSNRQLHKRNGSSCGLLSSAIKNAIESLSDYNYKFDEKLSDADDSEEVTTSIDNPEGWLGNGTGFFIDRHGFIATNFHVIAAAKEIEVEFVRNGLKEKHIASVIKADKNSDLAILKITSVEFLPLDSLPYSFSTEIVDVGTEVFSLGYPLALSLMGTDIKFTDGKISSRTGFQGSLATYQISVPIQPGNSGGPLFDIDGSIIGLTSAGMNRSMDITENVNYAIKSTYLKNLIDIACPDIVLPNDMTISKKNLKEKIKVLSDYVILIKIK
jgi:S1-C subfamily serine protease